MSQNEKLSFVDGYIRGFTDAIVICQDGVGFNDEINYMRFIWGATDLSQITDAIDKLYENTLDRVILIEGALDIIYMELTSNVEKTTRIEIIKKMRNHYRKIRNDLLGMKKSE